MFDFIAFANRYGVEITVAPTGKKPGLVKLTLKKAGFVEEHSITWEEAMHTKNIDHHIGGLLHSMMWSAMHKTVRVRSAQSVAQQLRDRQAFFEE